MIGGPRARTPFRGAGQALMYGCLIFRTDSIEGLETEVLERWQFELASTDSAVSVG